MCWMKEKKDHWVFWNPLLTGRDIWLEVHGQKKGNMRDNIIEHLYNLPSYGWHQKYLLNEVALYYCPSSLPSFSVISPHKYIVFIFKMTSFFPCLVIRKDCRVNSLQVSIFQAKCFLAAAWKSRSADLKSGAKRYLIGWHGEMSVEFCYRGE